MPHPTAFNNPFLLGFDQIERMLDRATKTSAEAYPPYNIEQLSEERLRIVLAVAGFKDDDLSIDVEDNQLIIRGKIAETEEEKDKKHLYHGIATRQFLRAFVLAEGIEVKQATLEDGLLRIDLERKIPESKKQQIKISKPEKKH